MELSQELIDEVKRQLRAEVARPERWEPIDPKEVLETVKVKAGDSFAVINKDDFDAAKHELCDADGKPVKGEAAKAK